MQSPPVGPIEIAGMLRRRHGEAVESRGGPRCAAHGVDSLLGITFPENALQADGLDFVLDEDPSFREIGYYWRQPKGLACRLKSERQVLLYIPGPIHLGSARVDLRKKALDGLAARLGFRRAHGELHGGP